MGALLIGGTGTVSKPVAGLALKKGFEVTLLNRGNSPVPEGMESLLADINHEAAARALEGRTKKYIYISSASDFEGELLGDKSSSVVFDNAKIKPAVPGFYVPSPWRRDCAGLWTICSITPKHRWKILGLPGGVI